MFDQFIKDHPFIFIMFYAPWCGHCKTMKPDYEKLSKYMIDNNKNVKICKIDATVETELAAKYNVSGYPTLLYIIDGKE